jgi:cation transport regulator ChaC
MKATNKLRGRPHLKQGKRTKKIDARFTDEEYQMVLDQEKELGVRKADLVRMRVLYNSKSIVVNARELIKHLDLIGAELGRSGNNINQLARYANILTNKGILSSAILERFNLLFENYILNQQNLEISLRKVIRMMGK